MEAISRFHRGNLLVGCVTVEGMAGVGGHECSVELRCTADETCVYKEVVVVVDIIVHTPFDSTTCKADSLGTLMLFVVVEAVHTPVTGVGERAVEESRQLVLVPLERSKSPFLHHVSGVVAIDDAPHRLLLVGPVGVVAVDIVACRNTIGTCGINEVVSAHQVADNRCVNALVVTEIDTCGEVKAVVEELVVVRTDKAIPVVVVAVLTDDELRTALAGSIEVFDSTVVESAILAAESGTQYTIVGTARQVGIGVLRVRTGFAGVSESSPNRGVERCGQAGLVVNLPYMVQTDLGFVVLVVVATFLLTIVAIAVSGIVATIVHAVGHVLLDIIPLGKGECTT